MNWIKWWLGIKTNNCSTFTITLTINIITFLYVVRLACTFHFHVAVLWECRRHSGSRTLLVLYPSLCFLIMAMLIKNPSAYDIRSQEARCLRNCHEIQNMRWWSFQKVWFSLTPTTDHTLRMWNVQKMFCKTWFTTQMATFYEEGMNKLVLRYNKCLEKCRSYVKKLSKGCRFLLNKLLCCLCTCFLIIKRNLLSERS